MSIGGYFYSSLFSGMDQAPENGAGDREDGSGKMKHTGRRERARARLFAATASSSVTRHNLHLDRQRSITSGGATVGAVKRKLQDYVLDSVDAFATTEVSVFQE